MENKLKKKESEVNVIVLEKLYERKMKRDKIEEQVEYMNS